MHFSFTSTVWAEETKLNNAIFPWQGASFEEALKDWLSSRTRQNLKAFPLIIAWGIWIARNSTIFRDEPQFPLRVVVNFLSILDLLKQEDNLGQGTTRRVQVDQIDKGWLWAFFDGVASGDHLLCWGGGLFIYK